MSYQYKKSSILYQLEQAIKKKVAEKPKSREQAAQKGMQPSLQKRKTQNLRQSVQRLPSKNKQSIKLTKADNMALFNNENLSNLHSNVMESKLAEHKKFNNRKLDKLFSLVNYAISSADKAMKYINYANFQGQFAVKLFKSDKENLFNQMKNLTCEDLLDQSSNRQQNNNSKINHVPSVIILQEENMKLKKQLAILQKQNERSRFGGQPADLNITLLLRELEIQKYKQSIYRIKGKQFIEKLENIIEKQLKYESIATKGHHSPSKQFEAIVKSLISERNNLCKDTQYLSLDRRQWEDIKYFIDTKMAVLANKKDGSYLKILQKYVATVQLQLSQKSTKKPHSQEHIQAQQQKISKIKEQKQELMRQIQLCKKKLGEMIEITKLKTEIEMHKKQMNKIHSKLLKSNVVEEESEQLSTDELINCVISKLKNREQDNQKQSELAVRLQQYQIQLQEYKNQNQILQKQLEQKISQINKLGLDKVKLMDKLNGKTKQYEKLQKQIDSIKRDMAKKQNTLKQVQKQNTYLISKLQQVQNHEKQRQQEQQQQQQQEQNQEIEKLNEKIEQQDQLILQYQQDKQKLIQELSSVNAQFQSRKQEQIKKQQHYKQQIQVMHTNMTKLSSENQQIKQDSQFTINSLEKDIQAINDKFQQVKQNYEKTINNLKKEMITNNEQHQKNVQEMQAQHDRQTQQLEQIANEYKTRSEQLKLAANQSQNKIKQKIEEIKRQLAESESKNKQLQHSLQQQGHNTDKLSAQIEQKNKTIGELQNNINQKTAYQSGMRQQIEGYRKRIIDMNTKMQQLQQQNKKQNQQQSVLKQSEVEKQQRQALQQACQQYKIENTDLKLELEQKIIELTEMYRKDNESTQQIHILSALKQEMLNKQQSISARQLQIEQKIKLISRKEQNVVKTMKQIEQKQIQLDYKQKQIQANRLQQLEIAIDNSNMIIERQKVKEKQLEERQGQLKQKQEQLNQKENRLDEQLKQVQINRNQLTNLKHQLDSRIKELQQKEHQYTNKLSELKLKQNEINIKRANLQQISDELKQKQSAKLNKQEEQEEQKQLIRRMLEQKQSEIIQQYEQKLAYIKQQTEQQLTNMKQLLQQTIPKQQTKIEHLNKQVEQLQKCLADKEAQLKQKEMMIAQYQVSQEQINAKVELLSNQLANMEQLKDKQMEQQSKQYKTKQNILQERIQVLDKQLNIKSHALHEISQLQASLQSQVQQKSVLIQRLEMKISMKQKEIENAHNRGQLLQQENKKLLEELCKIGEQISLIKQSQVEEATEQDPDKKKEDENNKQELINLLKNVEHMQERIEQFQTRQKQLSQLHESYKNSIKQLKDQLEQKNNIIKEKQHQYQDLLLKYQFNNINADELEQQRMKNKEQMAQINKKMEELSKNNKNLEQWKSVQLMYEKQYFNLSKRILSALFDLSQLGNVDEMGLRTLLEIGSQKAIQQKKRLRDQQSNEKRRRVSENQLEDQQKQNYYLKKQEYDKNINPSVDLFSTHSQLPGMGSQLANDSIKLQKKDEEQEKDIQNLQQFDNFQSGINSSMISEDGLIQKPFINDQQQHKPSNQNSQIKKVNNQKQKRQNQNKDNQVESQDKDAQNIEDFNDYQSEKMNQSMLSHNQEQKLNPFSQSKEQQNELNSGLNHQPSPQANKTQDIHIPVSVDSSKNKEEIKDGEGSRSAFQFDQFKDNNYSQLDSSLISQKHGDQPQYANKQMQQKGNLQIKLQQKFPANEVEKIKQQQHAGQDKFNIGMDISQIARTQPNNQGNNSMEFENFLEFQNSHMDTSMISQKLEKDDKQPIDEFNLHNMKALDKSQQKQVNVQQQNKNNENDFGDFNDYESNKLSESMISQTEIKIEKIQFEVKAVLNQDKQKELSLQKQQNDLDDFADFKSEKLDSSMMSNTDINLPQNQKQSVLPANEVPKEASNSANFDEFGEFNSQMNSSMMSDYENSSNK